MEVEGQLERSLKDAKDIVSVLNPFEYGCGKSLEEGCYNAAPNLKKITVEKGNQFFNPEMVYFLVMTILNFMHIHVPEKEDM